MYIEIILHIIIDGIFLSCVTCFRVQRVQLEQEDLEAHRLVTLVHTDKIEQRDG